MQFSQIAPGALSIGLLAIVLLAVGTYFAFTKANPFASPYELEAVVESANSLKPRSPVRVAGVNIGEVKSVKPLGGDRDYALIKMEIKDEGLPLRKDAELTIRSRLFLEGNYFVDIYPGTPGAPELESGGQLPSSQTAFPVQVSQVLAALQTDTRADLRTFLDQYSKALDEGGAEGFNDSIQYWERSFRDTALTSVATLGEERHDLNRLLKGQARVFGALASDKEALKGLITGLNTTLAAFASQEDNLRMTIPALRDVLREGRPALRSLNSALPSLRAFARDALPGARSSSPTLDAQLPFLRQARALVSKRELRGLSRELLSAVPGLVRFNKRSARTFEQTRALSACQNNVLLPFSKAPIPDPDFPKNSGQPWFKQAPRTFVGLAGESRLADANSPYFRVQLGGGPETILNFGLAGERIFSQAPFKIDAVRPLRPDKQPAFRPDIPCETQEPPNLNAASGPGDESVRLSTAARTDEQRERERRGLLDLREAGDHLQRIVKGLPSVDPLTLDEKGELKALKKLGLEREREGAPLQERDKAEERR